MLPLFEKKLKVNICAKRSLSFSIFVLLLYQSIILFLFTALEMQWKDLSTIIEQSLKDGKARTDQLHTYEKLRDQVLEWLTKNEGRVDALEPVAVDADILKRQTDELRVNELIFPPFIIIFFNLLIFIC